MQLSHHKHNDAHAQGHAHHLQQELLVLVPARLADVQARRPRVRGGDGADRRSRHARAELLLLSPSFLVPCLTARRRQGVGHAGDRRIRGGSQARSRPAAGRPRRARALPGDLRRDALGLRQPALGAADEPQGAPSGLQGLGRRAGRHRPHRRDLERVLRDLRRALPVRRRPRPWRTPCTRRWSTRFLTYDVRAQPRVRRLLPHHHEMAGHGANGCATPRPSRPSSKSSTWNSDSDTPQCRRGRSRGSASVLARAVQHGHAAGADQRLGREPGRKPVAAVGVGLSSARYAPPATR